ncbi:MAG: hypothetical protein QM805_05135 [Pseudomonas sp.]
MLRLAHAWFWVALWLYVLGRGTQAYPIGLFGAMGLAVLLLPGIQMPLALARQRRRGLDPSGRASGPLLWGLAGALASFLVLSGVNLLAYWHMRPLGASLLWLMAAVLLLHLLASFCITVSARWLPAPAGGA